MVLKRMFYNDGFELQCTLLEILVANSEGPIDSVDVGDTCRLDTLDIISLLSTNVGDTCSLGFTRIS